VPILQEVEAAGNTTDVDVDQQLEIESAGGDSLTDVPLSNVPLLDISLPYVLLPDVVLPDVSLAEACPDSSASEV